MKPGLTATLAIIGAPFLAIGFYVEHYFPRWSNSHWTGIYGLLYISGWLAAMEIFRRRQIAGDHPIGKGLLILVMCSLLLANLSNIWQLMAPSYKPGLFWALDIFWPVSNLLMIPAGLWIVFKGKLRGWYRFIPLLVGGWFPFSMLFQQSTAGLHLASLYSAIAWTIMALLAYRLSRDLNSSPGEVHT